MVLPSVRAKPAPEPENSEVERSRSLGFEVIQFMGSPAGWALATVLAGLLISLVRRRSGPPHHEVGSSSDV